MEEIIDERQNDVARAHRRLWAARDRVAKLEDAGRRAVRDREAVDAELSRAIDVFAEGDWGNLTLDEIAKASGRINRLARTLRAADLLPRAQEIEAGARREYERARGLAA
jgi:hypothetical protein